MLVSKQHRFYITIQWLPLVATVLLIIVPSQLWAKCSQFREPVAMNDSALWQDLRALSDENMEGRRAGSKGALKARQYIVNRLQEAGLEKVLPGDGSGTWFHPFKIKRLLGDGEGVNVVAKVTGTERPEKMIVVTAHYDHLGKKRGDIYPGANDNASGVAAMITLAVEVAKRPLAHTVLFVATDFEEAGLYGARAFIDDAVVPLNAILLNLNLDMLGQPGKNWTLYVTGTQRQPQYRPLVEKVAESAGLCLEAGRDRPSRSYDRKYRVNWLKASDHYEFHKVGIPWLFVGVKDYKFYHSPADKPEKLSRPFFAAVTQAILQLLIEIDTLNKTAD